MAASELVALVVLAATLLVFRTFRERYLLVWIVGWLAYLLSRSTFAHNPPPLSSDIAAIARGELVLAACLFAAALCVYTHARKWLAPLCVIAPLLISYAVLQTLLWREAVIANVVLETAFRLVLVIAATRLIWFRWARWEIGPWLLAISLLSLHLKWDPLKTVMPSGYSLLVGIVLGTSMLLLVFDDYKLKTQRLAVIHALTASMSRAQQQSPMMSTAIEQLKQLIGARAAWFRFLEGERLVLAQQIGLSPDYLRERNAVPLDEVITEVLREEKPRVITRRIATDPMRTAIKAEKFHHLVLVPIVGKKSPIGVLVLGSRRHIYYTPDDLDFLATAAHQLGLAFENFRLVEQILRSQRQWANTFDSIHDMVLVHDSEFRIMKANRALLERLRMAPADVVGRLCGAILPGEHEGKWKQCPYCSGDPHDGFFEGADAVFGGFCLVSSSSYAEQGSSQTGTIHVVRDTTDHLAAVEKYKTLFAQMQEGVFVTTPEGKLLDCNDAFIHILGYASRSEIIGLDVETSLYASPEQRRTFRAEMDKHGYVRNFEVALKRVDGSQLWALESTFATRSPEGKVERHQGFLLDITEKKKAEDEIRRRNRELNALNAMAVIATQSFDLDEILNLTLRQLISLMGVENGCIYLADADEKTFRRRAAWGQRSLERRHKSEVAFSDGFGDLVTRSRAEVITQEYVPHLPAPVSEFLQLDGDHSCIWVLLWGKDAPIGIMGISSNAERAYTGNDENLLVAIGRQLSTTIEKVKLYEETCRAYEDLRRTQEQLLQSEKMSAVGQLISGVAHELNNPLTAILGYAQLLESEGLSERASDFVSKLFKQAQRTHRVVQNLLSFARQRKPQRSQVDISKVLEETLLLRDYDLKVNSITLEREIEPGLPSVVADAHQLEQVFLNVINNAVDAMLEAGSQRSLKISVHADKGSVITEFHDRGPGIKEPNRIFDPFYTTKSIGKGTGLGLSICYGIVKEHGGEISARNRPEGGATVCIALPAAGHCASLESTVPAAPRESAIQGRLLLVEDEEAVLEFERDVLSGAGARVTTVLTIDAMKSRIAEGQFEAVIINGKMSSQWNATEIYHWIEQNQPGLCRHLLFTFSTMVEPGVRAFMNEQNIPHLVKPFEVGELIAQVRKLLTRTAAASASAS
jgi:PAS domain S-box-containing protein